MLFPSHRLLTLLIASYTALTTTATFASQSHSAFLQNLSARHPNARTTISSSPSTNKPSPSIEEINAESEQLRREIRELRAEAMRRLKALEESLHESSSSSSSDEEATRSKLVVVDAIPEEGGMLLPAPPPIVIKSDSTKKKVKKGVGNLLDETMWKISLSIGREPGTWMPKTWGISGQRLNLSFRAEFTPSQLYERDDFLRGGYSDAKILRVAGGKATLGPSVTEGQRVYNVRNGGWQVTQGDGPLGTDLLRFYIELEEDVTHTDCDLYIPKGRVYCSCGYFPFADSNRNGVTPTMKESYTKELADIGDQIQQLREKKDGIKNPFSLDKMKISREIGKMQQQAELVAAKVNFASVKEPDKSLLKFTKDMDVGLTREGGVCCKVEKGPMMVEYHILGRFSIANVEPPSDAKN